MIKGVRNGTISRFLKRFLQNYCKYHQLLTVNDVDFARQRSTLGVQQFTRRIQTTTKSRKHISWT